ncbi:transposase [bacterium]|nr:transposase [bacterium]
MSSRLDYLFPIEVMRKLFRGKVLDGLKRAYKAGKLAFQGTAAALAAPVAFQTMIDRLYAKRWVLYAKRPFGGSDQVLTYLGQYTHRVAISSYRIAEVNDDRITIRTRDERTAQLSGDEFIRRFLLHILPKGFRKIRHFGLMASTNVPTRLLKARQLLAPSEDDQHKQEELEGAENAETWEDLLEQLVGEQARLCPRCRKAHMVRVAEIPPTSTADESGYLDSS